MLGLLALPLGAAQVERWVKLARTATELDLTKLPAGACQVQLLDATGRLVRSYSRAAGLTHSLDLHHIASGTYLLLVRGTSPAGPPAQFVARLLKD